jgi:hypothetical protein
MIVTFATLEEETQKSISDIFSGLKHGTELEKIAPGIDGSGAYFEKFYKRTNKPHISVEGNWDGIEEFLLSLLESLKDESMSLCIWSHEFAIGATVLIADAKFETSWSEDDIYDFAQQQVIEEHGEDAKYLEDLTFERMPDVREDMQMKFFIETLASLEIEVDSSDLAYWNSKN